MARDDRDQDFQRAQDVQRASRRRRPRWARLGLIALALILVCVGILPKLLSQRSVVVGLANRYGGIAPLKLDLKRVNAGWFSAISADGIELSDASGNVLVRVKSVSTQKGVFGWLLNSSDLGRIQVAGFESIVVADQGTTNIEHALQSLWENVPQENDAIDETTSTSFSGTIEIVDSKLLIMQSGKSQQWVVELPLATFALPGAGQIVGPIELHARIGEASGTTAAGTGGIAAKVQQIVGSDTFELSAQLVQVPLDFWHVVHARFPDIPIEHLEGQISAQLAGSISTAENWNFDIQRLDTRSVRIVAPQLVGPQPAELEMLAASGKASLDGTTMRIESAAIQCDFANATASANIPWPVQIPSISDPFLQGAVLDARGTIDLPQLVKTAQSLIPMRAGTELQAGSAQFVATQKSDLQGKPTTRVNLTLADLKASSDGQPLSWEQPLSVDVQLSHGDRGPQFGAAATAEFFSLQGGGNIEAGQLAANIDLDRLHHQLANWIELPIDMMAGTADLNLGWKMSDASTLQAQGTLQTTPLTIAASTGKRLEEPAWTGDFSATALLTGGTPQQIQQAHLVLKAPSEQLTIDLQEPLSLVATTSLTAALPPARFAVNLDGNLEKWKYRGTMWLTEPPDLALAGNVSLAVNGRLDLAHVEITSANWRCEPIRVATSQMSFDESTMIGSFSGLVHTSDLTQLAVNDLKVQATSFSLVARDAAAQDGSGNRVGQAVFQADLDRLMKNMRAAAAGPTNLVSTPQPATPPATQIGVTGRVHGQLAWQVGAQDAAVNIAANGEQIVVSSRPPQASAFSPLWDEPNVLLTLAGHWLAKDGSASIDNLQLQTPWMTYTGNLDYQNETPVVASSNENATKPIPATQSVAMKGQLAYDCAKLSVKLTPFTGGQLQLMGQQTVPVELSWTSSADATASVLAGLQASTRIGWQQARVAGIEVGKADVPVQVNAGQLATSTEIPVSGGMLRWDITSDLTDKELVIHQKPMNVLERVEITEQMCSGWLKYVAPLLAETTSIDGRLSMRLEQANLTPANPINQTVVGQLVIHDAQVGPGPLSNQVITLVQQLDAIRKKEFAQAVSSQKVWLLMPEQRVDFQMVGGRVSHQNLNVKVGDARISTSGSVAIDGRMDMLATMPIPDDWADKSSLLVGMRGQSLQFPMGGTLSQPQLDSELLKQFSRQTVQTAAQGLIQRELTKGLGKLFGAPPGLPASTPSSGQ